MGVLNAFVGGALQGVIGHRRFVIQASAVSRSISKRIKAHIPLRLTEKKGY